MARRRLSKALVVLASALAIVSFIGVYVHLLAQPPKTEIKVGFAMSLTGRFAPGAEGQMQAHLLWEQDVNKRGGILVKDIGKRLPVKLVYYDDRSSTDTTVRIYEKLITDDKVDLLLGPYGTANVFAVVPIAEKYKAPIVASTGASIKVREQKTSYVWFTNPMMPDRVMRSLVDLLKANKDKFKKVAVIYLQELYTRENLQFLEPYLKAEGFEIVLMKDYPAGVTDLTPLLREVKAKNPDALLALTYPADSFVLTTQAKEVGLNPKFLYQLVGPAAVAFGPKFGPATEGIATMGHWTPKGPWPGAKKFYDDYVARWNKKPDYLNSSEGFAVGQVLEQAVEKAGTLKWEKVREVIANEEFMTINGPVRYKGPELITVPAAVMQWQKGELEIIWPPQSTTAKLLYPKPDWP